MGDLLGGLTLTPASAAPSVKQYVAPKQCWLDTTTGKGLEIHGTFARRNGQMYMDMTFVNRTTQVWMMSVVTLQG